MIHSPNRKEDHTMPRSRNPLLLTNTMSRKKERFVPRSHGRVDLFTCGPSIYRDPHLGNYRTFLYEDVLHRYLVYLGYEVHRLINYTDVEDKAIDEARRRRTDIWSVTGSAARRFEDDARILRMLLPAFIPRSSTSVDQAVHLINLLISRGHAYWYTEDVFYDPLTFDGFGRLYGLDMTRWPEKKRRFRRDTYPGQRWNRGDFILWHGGGEVAWDTAIGRGRPAWNVQDPAMITKHLGYRIDISCGGVDNLYRHHDYTIAVIEGASGEEFCPYWLHGAHLLADGEKMSKKKGNIVYPRTILEEGYSPGDIRFYLIYGHYRKRMNLTRERLDSRARMLRGFRDRLRRIFGGFLDAEEGKNHGSALQGGGPAVGILRAFEQGMNDDLDVKSAFDKVGRELEKIEREHARIPLPEQRKRALADAVRRIDGVLQVILL